MFRAAGKFLELSDKEVEPRWNVQEAGPSLTDWDYSRQFPVFFSSLPDLDIVHKFEEGG